MIDEVSVNIPFAVDSFVEATDKITVAAKIEVDSFMNMVIHNIGLDALQEKRMEALGGGSNHG